MDPTDIPARSTRRTPSSNLIMKSNLRSLCTLQAPVLAVLATSIFGGVLLTSPTLAATAKIEASTAIATDAVDDMIAEARALLVARDHEGARAKIGQIAEADGDTRRANVWSLRGQMTTGLLNDVLREIDKLARTGEDSDTNYLYGMAFAIKADQALQSGITDGTVGAFMTDAQNFLTMAVNADADRYDDAYAILAKVSRGNLDLDAAIDAGTKATEHYPKDSVGWVALGTAQLDRYSQISADESRAEEVAALGKAMAKSLKTGTSLLPRDKERASENARAWIQLGLVNLWLGDVKASADAYGNAMGWDPSTVDFGQLWTSLGGEFISSLDMGKTAFKKRYGDKETSDATMLWYLGYARFVSNDPKAGVLAEAELLESVEKWPAYANALYYVMQLRYSRQDYDGAVDIMKDFWARDKAATAATLAAELSTALPIMNWLVGHCTNGRLLDAALLSEMLANVEKPGDLHWSYKGLFLRDYADSQIRMDRDKMNDESVLDYYEQAVVAYEKALSIDPENPNYMNDLAVVLDYNLGREFERALALYDEAYVNAKRLMEDPNVSQERKDVFLSIALRDSKNNARRLRKIMDRDK